MNHEEFEKMMADMVQRQKVRQDASAVVGLFWGLIFSVPLWALIVLIVWIVVKQF